MAVKNRYQSAMLHIQDFGVFNGNVRIAWCAGDFNYHTKGSVVCRACVSYDGKPTHGGIVGGLTRIQLWFSIMSTRLSVSPVIIFVCT